MRAIPILPHLRRPHSDDGEAIDPTERGYLFETDAIIAILRGEPDPQLIRQLATVPARAQFISAITYGELIEGARGSPIPHGTLLDRLNRLTQHVSVLPFDAHAARVLAEIAGRVGSQVGSQVGGRVGSRVGDGAPRAAGVLDAGASPVSEAPAGLPLTERDLQVAAIALSNGLILVTGETERFAGVAGLKTVNWLSRT